MNFNVSQLMRETSGSSRVYEIDEEKPALGGPAGAPLSPSRDRGHRRITGKVKMLKTDEGIWVSAFLDTEAEAVCSRCLERYAQPVSAAIEEEFFPQDNMGPSTEYPNESLAIDEDNILDLTESVSQYLSLSSPMKPICRPECKGICLRCGSNLNETTCRCDDAAFDPRWGALLGLVSAGRSTDS